MKMRMWTLFILTRRSMTFFRSTSESTSSDILHEAILASSSSVRDSIPKQHREHFNTLRQEIIDFAQAHGIPRDTLNKPNALREAAKKLSIPDLTQLATLLERFEYLLKNKEPMKEDLAEALEHAERLYHLKEQYDSQIELLEQVGILKDGAIEGIDRNEYLVPTLEQIASRLFERRKDLKFKHDQGFTKLLLVPFGMSLDALMETFKQFLLDQKKKNPSFNLNINEPLWTWEEGYKGADTGNSPKLVYYPQSFTEKDHQGRTKMEILEEQARRRWTPTSVGVTQGSGAGVPGWTIHLLQPSDPKDQDSLGFAPISRKGKGTPQWGRYPLKANKTPIEYLSLLQKAQDDPYSPYFQESGMTPEDWIMAFILHFCETGRPLDDILNPMNTESNNCLIGAFFPSFVSVPCADWYRHGRHASFGGRLPDNQNEDIGVRSSVVV